MSEMNKMMLEDTKDLLDNIEITDIATQCKLLKDKEDEIAELEEKLKAKKAEADVISSEVIPELLKEQGLNEIKLADGSSVTIKTEYRATIPRDDFKRESALIFYNTGVFILQCLNALGRMYAWDYWKGSTKFILGLTSLLFAMPLRTNGNSSESE